MRPAYKSFGFTLIELLLAMGIAAVLFGISSIILSNLIPKANLVSVAETLKAEIRQQQLSAMAGEKDATDQAVDYGVLIESNQYSVFPGTTYSPLPSDSYTTEVPSAIQLSTNFANSVVIFEKGSGEVLNFDPNNRTITITDSLTGQSVNLTFNQYGVPE